jgi:hypothetical protein
MSIYNNAKYLACHELSSAGATAPTEHTFSPPTPPRSAHAAPHDMLFPFFRCVHMHACLCLRICVRLRVCLCVFICR